MKFNYSLAKETVGNISKGFFSRNLPVYLLSILLLNIIISPVVYSATTTILSKGQSYALVLLGLVTLSLFIYLFIVILQPEKF